jgi:acyl-CoA thioester hydrolase
MLHNRSAVMDLIRSDYLPNFPIVIQVPTAWGEMDSYGHVNNIVFFRHFESVRIALLDHIGFRDPGLNGGVGPILHSTQCRFRRPLTYPDSLQVGARVTDVAADRFTMEYRIFSLRLRESAADGSGVIVAYDYTRMEKAALPQRVQQRITELR